MNKNTNKTYLLICVLILVSAFQADKEKHFPKIIDNLPKPDKLLAQNELHKADPLIYMFGDLNNKSYKLVNINRGFNLSPDSLPKARPSNLKIFIDTTQVLSIDLSRYDIPPPPVYVDDKVPVIYEADDLELEYDEVSVIDTLETIRIRKLYEEREPRCVRSYPVYVENISGKDLRVFTVDDKLLMIQEVLDDNGKWRSIEYFRFGMCGNGYYYQPLPKNHFMLIKTPLYEGAFKTKMRLKMKIDDKYIFSNEIDFHINRNQMFPGQEFYSFFDFEIERDSVAFFNRVLLK
ncbi:hypothetical protein [Aureibacter tunicatorum]|uniref:Uncharacterized protein n=1 Tax=Aureibacter tunicatorum TaxID=866807 RepID=A0AAE3XQ99_9BACT|nr:hypothetical protein [Aureibacter tunicatorum]MDR6240075.1 hypothetical protein [Aureibacter tunicatorum]